LIFVKVSKMMRLFLALCLFVVTMASIRRYELHTPTAVVANTVGPFNNPTETYPYYSLPFCMGHGKQKRHTQDLGEVLSGSRKHSTPYELTFMDPVPWRALCEDYLDEAQVSLSISLSLSAWGFILFSSHFSASLVTHLTQHLFARPLPTYLLTYSSSNLKTP
jgi:hypothetical protein